MAFPLVLLIGASVIIVICILVAAYLLLNQKPYTFAKSATGAGTSLLFDAKRDVRSISVSDGPGKKALKYERKNIKGGETVEFVFPNTDNKLILIVEEGSGSERTYEV